MSKKNKIIIFSIICLIQIIAVFSGIIKNELVLKNGIEVKFKVEPIDPYDAFRGRYVILNFNDNVSVEDGYNYKEDEEVFVILDKNEAGFVEMKDAIKEEPKEKIYFKTNVKYRYDKRVRIEMPFDRYYIEEKYAKEAEKIYIDSRSNINPRPNFDTGIEYDVYVKVKLWRGKAVIEDMYVGDKNIVDYIESKK